MVLVVEITGPGDAAINRTVKPQLHALAGIPHYLRIELGENGPHAVVCRVEPGHPPVLTKPITVTLDLVALAATTRPQLSTVAAASV